MVVAISIVMPCLHSTAAMLVLTCSCCNASPQALYAHEQHGPKRKRMSVLLHTNVSNAALDALGPGQARPLHSYHTITP